MSRQGRLGDRPGKADLRQDVLAPDVAGALDFALDFPESPPDELVDTLDFSDFVDDEPDDDESAEEVDEAEVDASDEEVDCAGGIDEEPPFFESARESVR